MVATARQAAETFERLSERDRIFAMDFLTRLARAHELEKARKNEEFLNKVQRAIDQIEQGGGTVRDIIEVPEYIAK